MYTKRLPLPSRSHPGRPLFPMSPRPVRSRPLAGSVPQVRAREISLRFALLFLAGHAVLAVAMHELAFLATVHAWLSLALVGRLAFTLNDQARVISAVAYLGASEILWRMTGAGVFW